MADDETEARTLAPYAGFLGTLIARFEERLGRIQVQHNFEYGAEFEIAVCEVLREVMPARIGVCRGYVIGASGATAGDDIILFDRARFPTLRLLGNNLSLKEQVPADALLAYIEAKHTLYLGLEDQGKGQALRKAVQQVRQVKGIARKAVGLNEIGGMTLGGGFNVNRTTGFPKIKNPYVTAIWAPNVDFGGKQESVEEFLTATFNEIGSHSDQAGPDVIAAGQFIATPASIAGPQKMAPRPLLADDCYLIGSRHGAKALGVALFQLLWAIEWIELGPMPWSTMMTSELQKVGFIMADPQNPVRTDAPES